MNESQPADGIPEPGTDLALAQSRALEVTPDDTLEAILDAAGSPVLPSLDNFGEDPVTRFQLATIASVKAEIDSSSIGERDILCKWWCVKVVERQVNEQGEIERFPLVTIIAPDYTTCAFASGGVAQAMQLLVRAYGLKVFDPPLRLRLVRSKTARTREWFGLRVVTEKEAPQPKAKK